MTQARLTVERNEPRDVQDRVVHLWLDGESWDKLAYGTTRSREIVPGRHIVKAHNTLFGASTSA
jgi:hypothetical protein